MIAVVAPARAQRLVVDVRDSVAHSVVPGTLVTAIERATGARVFGVTNDAGRVALTLTVAGTWSTSIRRIGILPAQSLPVTVATGQTVAVVVATTSSQFRLPPVQVTAIAPSCARAPEGVGRAAALWDQMTLALRTSTLSADRAAQREGLHVTLFERDLARDRRRLAERALREGRGTERPFFAADPEALAVRGFVQRDATGSIEYFAPDERVILSDGFVRTHCFDAPESTADPRLAELRFVPLRGRSLADVAGTAFIDAATGELRRIEFRFVNVDGLFEGRRPDAGGDVALTRLQDGRWIVSGWTIRMPTYMRIPGRVERSLTGYREVGGSIRVLATPGELHNAPDDTASLSADSIGILDSADTASRGTSAREIERRSGFTMRRRGGPGIFLDSIELARARAATALQLLPGLPGMTLFSVPDDVPVAPAEADPDLAREWRAGVELPMMTAFTRDDGTQVVCLLTLFIDGRRAAVEQLVALPARNVVALEFYRVPREVPARFRREESKCGTALFWSFGYR